MEITVTLTAVELSQLFFALFNARDTCANHQDQLAPWTPRDFQELANKFSGNLAGSLA